MTVFGTLIDEKHLFSGAIVRTFQTDDGILHEFWFTKSGILLFTACEPRRRSTPPFLWEDAA